MSKFFKSFQLTTLGAGVVIALSAGIMTTMANADTADEIRVAQAAKISLKQAIDIASKQASGILTEAEFDDDDSDSQSGGGVYELEFSDGNTEYEIKVDAITGQVVDLDTDSVDSSNVNKYNVQQQAKIKIMDAIKTAEKQTSGRVLGIEFENDRDYADHATYYEVKVLKDNQIIELNIDADTGAVFANKFKK